MSGLLRERRPTVPRVWVLAALVTFDPSSKQCPAVTMYWAPVVGLRAANPAVQRPTTPRWSPRIAAPPEKGACAFCRFCSCTPLWATCTPAADAAADDPSLGSIASRMVGGASLATTDVSVSALVYVAKLYCRGWRATYCAISAV